MNISLHAVMSERLRRRVILVLKLEPLINLLKRLKNLLTTIKNPSPDLPRKLLIIIEVKIKLFKDPGLQVFFLNEVLDDGDSVFEIVFDLVLGEPDVGGTGGVAGHVVLVFCAVVTQEGTYALKDGVRRVVWVVGGVG